MEEKEREERKEGKGGREGGKIEEAFAFSHLVNTY